MDFSYLFENITNPAILFFILGIFSVLLKSDLEIPAAISKFISFYLLICIGFKGGLELSHQIINSEILKAIFFSIFISSIIPLWTFFILKTKFTISDSATICAMYGSVSAVTFVTAVNFLELHNLNFSGHMVAIMALMEFPAIIIGLLLLKKFDNTQNVDFTSQIKHSLTNSSVILLIGSLLIGFLANEKQAQGIQPFTNDLFKGFLSIFLLDMGIIAGKKLKSFFSYGWFPVFFSTFVPLINGIIFSFLSQFVLEDVSDRFLLTVLASSASYIAVPAAMKIAAPKSNPGLYLPMALIITFPINITLGFPFYFYLVIHS